MNVIAVHWVNPSSVIPHDSDGIRGLIVDAYNVRRDVANGAHVVILLLLVASRWVMWWHCDIPLSPMPQYPAATSVRIVFANGAHVVILRLFVASRYSMRVHDANPRSEILHSDAINVRRVLLCGAHVVILL